MPGVKDVNQIAVETATDMTAKVIEAEARVRIAAINAWAQVAASALIACAEYEKNRPWWKKIF
jgi:hypothetical protein